MINLREFINENPSLVESDLPVSLKSCDSKQDNLIPFSSDIENSSVCNQQFVGKLVDKLMRMSDQESICKRENYFSKEYCSDSMEKVAKKLLE